MKVASWAAAGTVPLSEALNAVTAACIETGLSEQEVVQTVIRAVPYGLANPQQAYAYEPWMDEVARGLSGAGGGSA